MKTGFAYTVAVLALLCFSPARGQIDEDAQASRGNLNKPEKLEWLQDAGFGMFIHLGVDSQLGVEGRPEAAVGHLHYARVGVGGAHAQLGFGLGRGPAGVARAGRSWSGACPAPRAPPRSG